MSDPKLYYVNGRYIRSSDRSCNFKLLLDMENYLIRRVSPKIIDISRYYPGVINKRGRSYAVCRDELFRNNISLVAKKIGSGEKGSYINALSYDCEIWLTEIAENIDAIKSSGCDKFFFAHNNAVDYFISRLSSDFICAEFNDILRLKESNFITFEEIRLRYDFGKNVTLKKVFEAVCAIRKGKVADPDIGEVIRLGLYAKDDLADMLAAFFRKKASYRIACLISAA